MLVLNRTDVESLLTPDDCLAAVERVMIDLSAGRVTQPARTVIPMHDHRDSALFMPARLEDPPIFGTKTVGIFPGNHRQSLPSHHAALLVFESVHGRPIALLEAASITAIRTAAVTALATRLLSRPESAVLALLGSGVQARSHLIALERIRDLQEVRVWSPREASRQSFAEMAAEDFPGLVVAVSSPAEAVRGADIITTVTAAREPIVEARWIEPGTHVNAIGASTATTREIDSATVAAARVFVDRRSAAMEEAGDLLIPLGEGRFDAAHVLAEIGEVAAGEHPGRGTDNEITLFESVGLAVQDLAVAAVLIDAAERQGLGTRLDWA